MLYAGVCLFTLGRHGNFTAGVTTPNIQWINDGTQFCVLEHNIKHLWVIMWHIFTSTNNTVESGVKHHN
jgi:hypothetical protein